jgi:hypothetical protein
MKLVIVLLCVSVVACAQRPLSLPKGAIPCRSDWDCPTNYVCGFAGVDQLPSCRYQLGADPFDIPQ